MLEMGAGRTGSRRIFGQMLAFHTAARTRFRGDGVGSITKVYAIDLLTTRRRLYADELHFESGLEDRFC